MGRLLELRSATPADAQLLAAWDREPHVIAAAPNEVTDWDAELVRTPDWRELLIAEVDGRPIGLLQLIDPQLEETHYWGDCGPGLRGIDIWIGPPDALGQGYGTQMMHLAIRRCFSAPEVTSILIDPLVANTRARTFYERLGFRFVEERWFDEDHCAIYRLDRADVTVG